MLNLTLCVLMFAVSVLNLHEDERQKPENWIPIGWIPVYYDNLSKRPGQGYEGDAARKARLFHDCFRNLLSTWDKKTETELIQNYRAGRARWSARGSAGRSATQSIACACCAASSSETKRTAAAH